MNLEKRERLMAIIAGAALAVMVGDHLILTPIARSWNERSERLADLHKRVVQGGSLLDRETVLRRRWADMRTNMLATEPSIAQGQVYNALYGWSQESGISITSVRPQVKQANDDSLTLECRADAFGSLSSLTHFLYLIEKDKLGVKIDSLDLTPRDKQADQLNLVVQISGPMLPPPRS